MGRPHTGYVEWRGGEWKTRVTDAATGLHRWLSVEADVAPEQRLKQDQKPLAQKLALLLQKAYEAGGFVPSARAVTVREFFKNVWIESRRRSFPNQVEIDTRSFDLWIDSEIGGGTTFRVRFTAMPAGTAVRGSV